MEGLTAWVSHYGIFLIAAAGAAALLCAFLARGKKLRWGAAAGALGMDLGQLLGHPFTVHLSE